MLVLHKESLESYQEALCNDGSPALYYIPGVHRGSNVFIYLEGGGSCTDIESCNKRCQGKDEKLCSSRGYEETLYWDDPFGPFSEVQEKNPAFHDWFKVYVPYCSSDQHAGMREASNETADLYFYGRNIVASVVDDLYSEGLIGNAGQKVVLIGASAGGAGVARNCDFVSDRLRDLGSQSSVSCVMDGADFEPYWMTTQCDLINWEFETSKFWNAQEDTSCRADLGPEVPECSAFSMFWSYIESPFMIVSSEADPVVHFCSDNPEDNSEGSYGREWREGMVDLAFQVIDSGRTDIGIFLANCPFHVGTQDQEVYQEMGVTLVDDQDSRITLSNILYNWVNSDGFTTAIDHPEMENPAC